MIIIRLAFVGGTGCAELPPEDCLALPGAVRPDFGLFDWLLEFLAQIEECCTAQPTVRLLISRILAERSMP